MHEMHGALSRYWFTRLDSGAVALLSSNICTQVDENSNGCTDARFGFNKCVRLVDTLLAS